MNKLYILIIGLLLITFFKVDTFTKSLPTSLFGINIIIDPGHGGKDNGTYYENVLEDEITLNIATKLMNICIDDGAISSLTRVGDYDLASQYAKNRKREDLKKRVEFINSSNADYFISLHLNSYPNNKNVYGPMVYYKRNDEESKNIAISVMNSLNELANTSKPIHPEDFYLFKYTNAPGILVECGFLSNYKERELLLDNEYQEKIARTIYKGLDDYLLGKKI